MIWSDLSVVRWTIRHNARV